MAGQLLTMAAPLGADLPPAMLAKLRGKAQEFEAVTLGQLLEPMFDTVDSAHGLFGGGNAEQTWRPMLVSEVAKQIARAGGIGLAQPVLRSLIEAQESGGEAGGQAMRRALPAGTSVPAPDAQAPDAQAPETQARDTQAHDTAE